FLCRGGACGRCEQEVLECDGVIMHNDHYLSDAEKAAGNRIMPCVSRAKCTHLVLNF
ncbi:MAG: 2Fe-2S iron-sulfur cluster-binding protein, partial [Methylophaga sp.]